MYAEIDHTMMERKKRMLSQNTLWDFRNQLSLPPHPKKVNNNGLF